MKALESNLDSKSNSNLDKVKQIIDVEPSATITTTNIHPNELEESEEGERLFHLQMWVKGASLHFIVDRGSQNNLISEEVVKGLELLKTLHTQPYNIKWLNQGRDLHVSQQCHLHCGIKPFKDEELCDFSPLEVCNVLLGQPYMWKHHVVYESRPCSVIVTMNKKLYKIPEVAPATAISLVSTKNFRKVIS
jgi:hypothetical protein